MLDVLNDENALNETGWAILACKTKCSFWKFFVLPIFVGQHEFDKVVSVRLSCSLKYLSCFCIIYTWLLFSLHKVFGMFNRLEILRALRFWRKPASLVTLPNEFLLVLLLLLIKTPASQQRAQMALVLFYLSLASSVAGWNCSVK